MKKEKIQKVAENVLEYEIKALQNLKKKIILNMKLKILQDQLERGFLITYIKNMVMKN